MKRWTLIGVVVLALVVWIWFMLRPSRSGLLSQPVVGEAASARSGVLRRDPPPERLSAGPAGATAQNNCSISGRVLDMSVSYARPTLLRRLGLGRLKSERNEPLTGVRILQRQGREGPVVRKTFTDGDGRYTFQGLSAGDYTIEAEPPADALNFTYRPHTVRLQPGEHKEDVDFHFRLDSVVMAGQVTDTRGYPIEGVTVVADPVIGESYADARKPVSVLTDEDGRYRIEGIVPTRMTRVASYITKGRKPKLATYALRARAHGYTAVEVIVPSITDSLLREAQSLGYVDPRSSAVAPLPTSYGNVINIDFVLEREAAVVDRNTDEHGRTQTKDEPWRLMSP